jgi:putative copper export protein
VRARPRRAVIGSTIALGTAAALLGTITGGLVGARWSAPASPSDDAALGTTQALGNVSVASFTAALPLLSAGLTAWIRGRIERPSRHMARRGHR